MSEENLNLDIQPGVAELVYKTHEIPTHDLVERCEYRFKGNIHAPYEYYDGKRTLSVDEKRNICFLGNPQFEKFDMVVEADLEAFKITFIENNHHNIKTAVIVGEISFPKEFAALGINQKRKWTSLDLAEVLKMNRLMFATREENMRIVTALRNFKAKIETDLENKDDLKGNKLNHYAQSMRSEHANELKFKLSWPVIIGEPKAAFEVDINFDLRDKAIEFWLESVELKELQEEQANALMTAELSQFDGAGITIVRK